MKTLVLDSLLLLEFLPDSVCQLSSLETFFLLPALSCSFGELPADFCCLTALTTLCLGGVALPADIGRLRNLHTLLLRDSYLSRHLPCSLSEVASLTRLELNECDVELLPEGVWSLSNLRELHLSYCCELTALPASVTCLTALEALSLADSPCLASVPTRLDGLTRLKQLEAARCDMLIRPPLVLPASIEWLSWRSSWSQKHAMALLDVSTLTGLRTLRLDKVSVACGVAVSRSLSHLEHLHLNLAGVAEELPFPLTFLSRLRTLIIDSAWSLQRLPADIGLRELHLIGCEQLEQLPASLTQLACLNKLSIRDSPIRSLCSTAAQFTRLKSLDLSGCVQLEAMPGDLSALKALQELRLFQTRLVKDTDGSVLSRSMNEEYWRKKIVFR
ncbi:unnamed protein product [Closterium sp. NIES-64]|nr:unnamed protein product [Closterium sp. NIES-64]